MENKPRLIRVTNEDDAAWLRLHSGELSCPYHTITVDAQIWADADQFRVWRKAHGESND
jgi:hypothetical protein